jgi:hypothetical protein
MDGTPLLYGDGLWGGLAVTAAEDDRAWLVCFGDLDVLPG